MAITENTFLRSIKTNSNIGSDRRFHTPEEVDAPDSSASASAAAMGTGASLLVGVLALLLSENFDYAPGKRRL